MNNRFQLVGLRTFAVSGLLGFAALAACSSTNEPNAPEPPKGGSGPVGTSGSGTTGGGGSTGTGGSGGSAGSTTGGSGGTNGCPPGQQIVMGACGCAPFAPNYCADVGKCANFTKDPLHCGDCATACGPTQACSASACTPELTPVAEIVGCGMLELVYANTTLYALNTMTGELSSVPTAGGAPVSIATGLTGATAFAVDATSAYVAAGMKVIKVTLAGGATVDLVTETSKIFDVTVTADSIYYALGVDASLMGPDAGAGSIRKASNSAPTAAPMVVAVGIDKGQPGGVAVSGVNVLYSSDSAKNVEVQPIGGTHVKLGASQGSLIFGHRTIQTDDTWVYWASGTLQRAKFAAADSHLQEEAGASAGGITAYAVNTANLTAYFASDTGDLEKAAFTAAPATMAMPSVALARALEPVSSIVTDATSVYIASGCKILKTAL